MAKVPLATAYFSPRKGCAATVVGFIDRCAKRLDIAIFALTRAEIAEAVVRANARGVKVRVIMDKDQAEPAYSKWGLLVAGGVPLRIDTMSGLFHHKFCIGDRKALITGSFNWTDAAEKRNAENLVIIRIKRLVDDYQAEFDRLWALNAGVAL